MSLLDLLVATLAPHDCLGCGSEGSLLCRACDQRLAVIAPRCYRCRRLSNNFLTCPGCRQSSRLKRVTVSTVYDGLAKDLVWKLKFAGAQAAVSAMTSHMLPLITLEQPALIVPVPTATSRVRQRGYDQARLLARQLAKRSGQPYVDALSRVGQQHQVGANRQQRLKQLDTAFRAIHPHLIKGLRIILIDDVVTTGATLEAAARTLKAAGAGPVEAIVFAQP